MLLIDQKSLEEQRKGLGIVPLTYFFFKVFKKRVSVLKMFLKKNQNI
jgi:hypothetical protein